MYSCTRCSLECRSHKRLLLHYRFVHSLEAGFNIRCGVNGCEKTYNIVKSLLKHMKRNHSHFYNTNIWKFRESQKDTDISENLMFVEYQEDDDTIALNDENNEKQDLNTNLVNQDVDLKKKSATFLLNLREKCKLPANSLPIIVEEFSDMLCLHQSQISQKLDKALTDLNVEELVINKVMSVMKENSDIESTFLSFDTAKKLNQYAIDDMGMVEPIEYVLGHNPRGNVLSMQYIPIMKSVKKLLDHEDVLSYVLNYHKSVDGVLRDVCDGSKYNNCNCFNEGENKLQILLFYDDFTVTNPIGHAVKKYNISAFYMLLANLPPKYRSQLHVIQLVALVEADHLKEYGFRNTLQPLIQDIKELETNGIVLQRPEGRITLHGRIIAVIGDNLGVHAFGGFTESFTLSDVVDFIFFTKRSNATSCRLYRFANKNSTDV